MRMLAESGNESGEQLRLILRGLLARTLFHRKVWRIGNFLDFGPRGKFLTCDLPSANLIERQREVHVGRSVSLQGQTTDIVVGMQANKLPCSLV